MYLVNCWIEHPTLKIDRLFSYLSEVYLNKGVRVRVNFNYKDIIGFVDSSRYIEDISALKSELGYSLKPIKDIIDQESILNDELYELGKWMAKETLSPTIACFQTMLPKKIKPISNFGKIVKVKKVRVKPLNIELKLKELTAYQYLLEKETLLLSEYRKLFKSYVNKLIDKEVIEVFEEEKNNSLTVKEYDKNNNLKLTEAQSFAMKKIIASKKEVILLHGITGSGKTEIYLQLAGKIIEEGKQVLFLVPEISLTPQMVKRVKSRFYDDLAIYHSGLNAQEKYEQYKKVLNDEVKIVVGTRSAAFMPFNNLGLIIMDEEHDLSYKQDSIPMYHCRDIAVKRAAHFKCKVLLGSATPSLESYARALKGVYELVELSSRINNKLPNIKLINVNDSSKKQKGYILSEELKEKIAQVLKKQKQVILLLNRRGFSTSIRCKNCNTVIMCPHCDISMSYHHDIKMLKCHTCNTTMPYPVVCPGCNGKNSFFSLGFGTQKLEEEVKSVFKGVRVIRMDSDTTSKKNAHETLLEAFSNHEADILLGTQMISKGLDYPDVTLVGIINGDAGIHRIDYRSQEVVFDMLTQASGRSGRSDDEGEVIIQVYDDNNYVINSVLKQDYKTFFKQEMNYRKAGGYPPYTYLISIIFSGRNRDKVNDEAYRFKEVLQGDFKVLGPSDLLKLSDQYRFRIILKGKDLNAMRSAIVYVLNNFKIGCAIKIDVNPLILD